MQDRRFLAKAIVLGLSFGSAGAQVVASESPIDNTSADAAYSLEGLVALDLHDRRSGYPLEMVVRASDSGWRLREVEVDYHERAGRSKVTGTPLGVVRAVRDMSRVLASGDRT